MNALCRGLLIAIVIALAAWFGWMYVTSESADLIVEGCFDNAGRWYTMGG